MKYHSASNVYFNIANINRCTGSEGPFKRMAIWFQGCNIYCKSCCNPELQPFRLAHLVSLEELIEIAFRAKEEFSIEGVTLTGGEPTMQIIGLIKLCAEFKKLDLGIILYSGNKIFDIPQELLKLIDLLVDGMYIEEFKEPGAAMKGSKNQDIHHLTKRYLNIKQNKEDRIHGSININDGAIINGDVLLF